MDALSPTAHESWLLDKALALPDLGAIVEALAQRLRAGGVPVTRATAHVQTLHPRYVAVSSVWDRRTGLREARPLYDPDGLADYSRSPLRVVRDTGRGLNVRLDRAHGHDIPMFEELHDAGLTHYIMAPLRFSDGTVNGVSWSTDAEGGFEAEHVDLLLALVPTLSLVVEIKCLNRMMPEILTAYVGHDPARRILAGSIHRGDVSRIRAAMVSFDLRGFSAVSSTETPERVVEWLNGYFDSIVPGVEAEGGDVLKFLGDGALATFPVDGEPAEACHRALRAARNVVEALMRKESDIAPYHPVAALHLGTIAYGNIGASDRLDFTVVGADVNLVSRLETLCKDLDLPLLMSEAFAVQVGQLCTSLGEFNLRGFNEPVTAYGWCGMEPDEQNRDGSDTGARVA